MASQRTVGRTDSPSRQIQFELERALDKLQIYDSERQRVHAYNRRSYHDGLDAKDLALKKAHQAALDAATAQHEAVRKDAEAVLQRYLKEQEEERKRREEEDRRKREREAQEKAERERRAKEQAERQARLEREKAEAEAQRAAEERARIASLEAQKKLREETAAREKTERQRAEKEKAERERSQEEAAEKERARQQAAAKEATVKEAAEKARAAATTHSTAANTDEAVEKWHNEYLELHKKLKSFRSSFWDAAKADKNGPLKKIAGDSRRTIKQSTGQLVGDKAKDKLPTDKILQTIRSALKEVPSPMVSVNDFLPTHLSLNDNGETKIPSLAVYLLSIFTKVVITSFANEAGVKPEAADPVGTVVSKVFATEGLQFQRREANGTMTNISLIAILMSKMHKAAPLLFGISGMENTNAGRIRLGWRLEGDPKGFIPDNRQQDRTTGLGAGYASIALRNFSRAKMQNPYPPTHFWESLAGIINTEPNQVQLSHLVLLLGMLTPTSCERVVQFFGAIGVALLREALVEFPKRLPNTPKLQPSIKAMSFLVDDTLPKLYLFRLR